MQTIIEVKNLADMGIGSELIKAVKQIDLSIQQNEFVALMGQSGLENQL